jgi:hypothetical protein
MAVHVVRRKNFYRWREAIAGNGRVTDLHSIGGMNESAMQDFGDS